MIVQEHKKKILFLHNHFLVNLNKNNKKLIF